MTKITDLSALTGASVVPADDLIPVVDFSETGAARNKKMTFAELKVAIGSYTPGGTDVAVSDGGTGASTAAGARTNLGATTVGSNVFTLTNPSAVTFLRVNADNTVDALTASAFRTAIGAGTGSGSGDLLAANNLSDLASAATARTNLGLGSAAVLSTSDIDERARDALGTALVAGSNITITPNDGADTITIAATGGGTSWNLQWSPMVAEFPLTNFATLDSRNNHPCLDFDTTTQEAVYFSGVLNSAYTGAGVTINLWVAATSATSGTIGWDVAFERIDASSLDIDADSFGSATTVTAVTVSGTSGQVLKMSVNVSNGANMDSLAAGEMFRLRIRRDVANDTATGDAELLRVEMVSQ